MCLFRCRGSTLAPSSTVMRASCRCPCTVPLSKARPGSLEAHLVPRLGVADVDLAVDRVGHHVEEHRADVGEARRSATGVAAEASIAKTSRSGRSNLTPPLQSRPSSVVPLAARRVEPDDQADLGARNALDVDVGRRQAAGELEQRAAGRRGRAAVAHRALAHRRGLVAGLEHGGVHRVAVGAARQRARRVAEQLEVGDRRAGERGVGGERRRVEHLHDGSRPCPRSSAAGSSGQFWPRRAVVTKAR